MSSRAAWLLAAALLLGAAATPAQQGRPAPAPPVESTDEAEARAAAEAEAAEAEPAEAAAEPEAAGVEPGAESAAVPSVTSEEGEGGELGERSFVSAEVETGGGRDDSDGLARPSDATDFYFLRAALLLYERPSSRSAFTLAYEPELEQVSEGDTDQMVNHAVGALLEHQASRDFRWLIGGSLLDGDDPSRYLGGLQFVLPISPYRQTRAFTTLERRLERTTLGLSLGYGATEIAAVEGVMREVDQSEVSAQASLDRETGPRSSVGVGYAYLRPEASGPFLPLGPDGEPIGVLPRPGVDPVDGEDVLPIGLEPTPIHAATLGFRFRPREAFELQLTGGAARDGHDRTTGIASAELREHGERGSVRLRLDRSLVALGGQQSFGSDPSSAEPVLSSGLLRDSVETSITLGVHRKLAQWLWWEQLLWAARTSVEGDDPLESLAATTRLVFRTPWRLCVFAEIDYFDQRVSSAGSTGISRLRYAIGLRADAGGPPGTRGFELQRERLLRVLPDRGGE